VVTSPVVSSTARGARSRFDLSGRVAIVTGATKGLGRAIAEGLAEAGASVVVSSRKQDLCERVAGEISARTGRPTLPLACHVAEWDAVPDFVATVLVELGRIDVLVNNAGIFPAPLGVREMTREYWRKVFAVNLEGPLRLSQCAASVMRDHGGGSIINITSTAAVSGGNTTCAYAASKAALINLTKSMALEWAGWKVRVNALSPGTFRTEMTASGPAGAEYLAARAAGIPMHRVGEPDEIVGPVLYLASDASSFVTGDELTISGGRRA
jgi:NAD(P)-dependent dehydrogenase (short-subunit alcohol dehydrogenase family)